MYVVWIPSTNSEGAVFDIFHTVFFFSSKIIYYVSKCFFLHVLTREYILSILWVFYTSTYNMTKRKQKSQFIVNKYICITWIDDFKVWHCTSACFKFLVDISLTSSFTSWTLGTPLGKTMSVNTKNKYVKLKLLWPSNVLHFKKLFKLNFHNNSKSYNILQQSYKKSRIKCTR